LTKLRTTVARTTGELDALGVAWRALDEGALHSEIFRSFEWLRSWWEVFGDTGERALLVICVHDGDELVGIAPLQVSRVRRFGLPSLRRLELLGTGEAESDEVCSDFLDLIVAPGYGDAVADVVCRALLAEHPRWDVASFTNLSPASLLWRCVAGHAEAEGCTVSTVNGRARHYVDLGGQSYDGYLARLSPKRRKHALYCARRVEREGGLEEVRVARREDLGAALGELGRLSRLRRSSQGLSSAFDSARFCRFQEVVAPRLFDRGWLDLRLYRFKGVVAAALCCFVHRGSILYYQSGYDTEAFGKSISPGVVTLNGMVAWGIEQKLSRFDFLVGPSGSSYKDDYPCVVEPIGDVLLYNTTLTGRLIQSARTLRALLRGRSAGFEVVYGAMPLVDSLLDLSTVAA
jgi:CelD/BcsL family acetyltransferase involved in cellulose biosynthesis